MKKFIYLMVIFLGLMVTGCTKSKLNKLSLDELYNKINNKDSFVVYFEVTDNALKNKLEKAATNNKIEAYVIDANKISNEEKIKLQPIISYEDSAIVFIVDGKDPSILSHITNSDTTVKEIESRLKDMNYVK
jgi:hypothetical protein